MVSLTAFVSAISMALLATTATAAPAVVTERQPPTSSVLQATLYKTQQAGQENQCWWGAPGNNFVSVPPSELVAANGVSNSNCHQGDYYTLRIWNLSQGYNCQVKTYSDDNCNNYVGAVGFNSDFSKPCTFPNGSLVNLKSWKVSCV